MELVIMVFTENKASKLLVLIFAEILLGVWNKCNWFRRFSKEPQAL